MLTLLLNKSLLLLGLPYHFYICISKYILRFQNKGSISGTQNLYWCNVYSPWTSYDCTDSKYHLVKWYSHKILELNNVTSEYIQEQLNENFVTSGASRQKTTLSFTLQQFYFPSVYNWSKEIWEWNGEKDMIAEC